MTSESFITLKGGLTLPVDVLHLAWTLERRGLRLSAEGDVLRVEPGGYLTDAERDEIRRCKLHLLALVDYCNTDRVLQ